jgi:hypothetical protein
MPGTYREWHHSESGLVLPAGSTVIRQATPEYLDWIERRSDRRGVRVYEKDRGKVRRSAADSLALDELCIWLNHYQFDIFFSVTFSDAYAKRQYGKDLSVYSLRGAVLDVLRGLNDLPTKTAWPGFTGRLVLAAEMTDRNTPHVHGVLASCGMDVDWLLGTDSPKDGALWQHFHETRGRCRFELIRDQDEATLYAFKDTLKRSAEAEALLIRLRPKNRSQANKVPPLDAQQEIFATRHAKRQRNKALDLDLATTAAPGDLTTTQRRQGLETLHLPDGGLCHAESGEHGLTPRSQSHAHNVPARRTHEQGLPATG